MRFSVVIPALDDQAGLDRACSALLSQTYQDFEVIVVDDGSRIPQTVVDDRRFKVIRHEVPMGPAVARNVGMAMAVGDIIAFCDSDDYFVPNRLAMANKLHHRGHVCVVGQTDERSLAARAKVPQSLDKSLDRMSPHLGATSVFREFCPRFDEAFLACQDTEWWIRLVATGIPYASTPKVGYVSGASDRPRVLNSKSARIEFQYALLSKHRIFFDSHREAKAFRLFRIATLERREGNLALARISIINSWRARPSRRAVFEAWRLLRAATRSPEPPIPWAVLPLPPLAAARGKLLKGLERGTRETAQSFDSLPLMLVTRISVRMPRALKGRARRLMVGTGVGGHVSAKSCWGVISLPISDTRFIAPYADEPLEMALLARYLRPEMNVIDIGANRGYYTLMFAARVGPQGKVFAIEPDERMVRRLRDLIDRNSASQVVVVQTAVAGESGRRMFILTDEPSLNHLAPLHEKSDQGLETDCTSYSDLLRSACLERVDLLKIDVEGAEPEVLSSVLSSESLPDVIMAEFVATQWSRNGDLSVLSVFEKLTEEYVLFAVDYDMGALRELMHHSDLDDSWNGRNFIAVKRDRVAETLPRMTFS